MRTVTLLLALCLPMASQAEDTARFLEASATGWVDAAPDMLSLDLSLQATGDDVDKLQRGIERTAKQVLAAAREQGVAEADINSSRASVRPEYEWQDGKRLYRGQTVQRGISIMLRDLERYGPLLQALSRLDIHELGEPRPGHSKLVALQLDAMEQALANARTKAERMANTLGVTLGEVISARERLDNGAGPMAARMLGMESAPAPNIQFGKQRISAAVTLRYSITD